VKRGPARIVGALRQAGDRPCSGAQLSEELGVSRTQIWKHIEALRELGYEIEGAAGGGYRLLSAPDRLLPEEIEAYLHTRWLAREIEYFESIDSTNRQAMKRGREGAPGGTTIIAETQSAGRGRLGRSFFSPPFRNLYTTVLLRPRLTTADAPTLVHAAAIAVADALASEADPPDTKPEDSAVEIKWPNDVLIRGKKATGILMELSAEAARVDFAVLGIGVNLNVEPDAFPDEFRDRATSLSRECGRPIARARFAAALYDRLETVLDEHAAGGLEALRSRYEARFRMCGRTVRVEEVGGASFEGSARGIDVDGALLLESADGALTRVLAGDVTVAREGGK